MDPTAKEVTYNVKYDDMYAAEVICLSLCFCYNLMLI